MEKRTSIREARARFCELTKGSEAVAVGTAWQLRAIIVPIPQWSWGDTESERKKAAAKARAAFNAALEAQLR